MLKAREIFVNTYFSVVVHALSPIILEDFDNLFKNVSLIKNCKLLSQWHCNVLLNIDGWI